jgi:hypothetical protein
VTLARLGWALLAALAIAAAGWWGIDRWRTQLVAQGDKQGAERVQAAWDRAERDRATQHARQLEQAQRVETAAARAAEGVADDQARRESALRTRVARLDARVRELQQLLAAGAGAAAGVPGATAGAGAAAGAGETCVARELLGACGERYAAVAADADALREQVIGLQQFAAKACKAGAAGAGGG